MFQQEFGWLHWVYSTAEGFLGVKDILSSNLFEWFTFVNYTARKNSIENLKARQSIKKAKK